MVGCSREVTDTGTVVLQTWANLFVQCSSCAVGVHTRLQRVHGGGGQLEWKQHCPKPTTHQARPAFPARSPIFSAKYFVSSVSSSLRSDPPIRGLRKTSFGIFTALLDQFWSFSVLSGTCWYLLALFGSFWYFCLLLLLFFSLQILGTSWYFVGSFCYFFMFLFATLKFVVAALLLSQHNTITFT